MENINDYKTELLENLQTAVELEHSTIPPYLTAYFTINQDTNAFAWGVIRSVFMEEMLHMTLACNILNAVGGSPVIDKPEFIPEYPAEFNFGDRHFEVDIAKFSKKTIETFLKIEAPSAKQGDEILKFSNVFLSEITVPEETIGEFYQKIKDQLCLLVKHFGEKEVFNGDPKLQIMPKDYYGGGGEIIVVHNLQTALDAIDVIIDQGEGASGTIYDGDESYFGEGEEVAHFYRFAEIYLGKKYKEGDHPKDPPSGEEVNVHWEAASNMINNPKMESFPEGSAAKVKAKEFNDLYSHFLRLLHLTFNGQSSLIVKAIGMMYQMKYVAAELLNCKIEGTDQVAGPPFEYIPLPERKKYDWLIDELVLDLEKEA